MGFQLLLSLGFLMPQILEGELGLPHLWESLPFAVPATLYTINNNLAVHMQLQMDPATYQVIIHGALTSMYMCICTAVPAF